MSQFGSEPIRDPVGLGCDKARLARLTRWMQRYADTGRWPGGAVLIARHGELAFFSTAPGTPTSKPSGLGSATSSPASTR
jgi:hypothetical protein